MGDKTALEMKAEIEKSADLYPYFDYAFGYGVPQAAYFTGDLKPAERSFNLVQEKDGVKIMFSNIVKGQEVFFNVEGEDGVLLGYYMARPDSTGVKLFNKDFDQGKKLNVSYNGFYDSCPISGHGGDITVYANSHRIGGQDGTFRTIKEEGWQKSTFFQYDYNIGNATWNGFNRHFAFGRRWFYGKTYKIGMGLGLDWNRFVAKDMGFNNRVTTMRQMQVRGELLQRIPFRRLGLNWDLGLYGGINVSRSVKEVIMMYSDEGMVIPENFHFSPRVVTLYNKCTAMNLFEYGATTRISYSIANMFNIGIYGSYRLSPVITKDSIIIGHKANNPSAWSVGIEFELVP